MYLVNLENSCMSLRYFRHRILARMSLRISEWSPAQNSTCICISSTRCPVMTHEFLQFYGVDIFGSGRSRYTCMMVIWMTYCPCMCYTAQWNKAGMKSLCRESSTCLNYPTTPCLAWRTKSHSYCRDFCRSTYGTCRFQHATSTSVWNAHS